jgi:hypothetical protein
MLHISIFFDDKLLLKVCDGCKYDFDADIGQHTLQAGTKDSHRGLAPHFEANKHYYYLITTQTNKPVIIPVTEEEANFELQGLKTMTK